MHTRSNKLGIMNLSLAYNILMHGKENAESLMIIRSSVFSSAIGVLLARQHSAPGLFSSFGVLRVIKGFEEDLESGPKLLAGALSVEERR